MMAKVKKMAFGGIGRVLKNAVKPAAANAANAANAARTTTTTTEVNTARQRQMADAARGADESRAEAQRIVQARPPNFAADYARNAMANAQRAAAQTKPTGLGAAMSGSKTGLGTAMGMNKLAGAGAALGKKLGMKSGGSVSSASKRADGIATKGKTKGKMV